ncbi:MAG: tRNA (N6-threonylcarbamoyladenosine(37)-N6)-methyltransferase TrmO, partial [Anaerolineae bacterium]|nr:tRNA (N6-threonylcarbamoyladenosine(37)-N6)-methyltransferase TrmO [Anaerolineae bacterium]
MSNDNGNYTNYPTNYPTNQLLTRRRAVNRTICLTPIGFVRSQFTENTPPEEMRRVAAQIVIEPEFEPGLMGLQLGQDIQVLFYFNKIQADEIHLHLHPRHNPDNPLAGVFATRTQFRPNQIGATVACIEQIEGNVLTVTGLDAQDGTPVLDIKPYIPYFDTATTQQQFEVREVTSLDEARAMIDVIDAEIIRLF